jgi:V/A-type H+-transporting ATPase subunit I
LVPVRMRKLRALVLDEFIDNVLTTLQLHGNVHVVDIRNSLTRWENLVEPFNTEEERRHWQGISERVDKILSELGLEKELGLLDQLFKPRERAPLDLDLTEETRLLGKAEDMVTTVENEIEEKIKKFQAVRGLLMELGAARIDVEDLRSTEVLYIKFGKMAIDELPGLEIELKSRIGSVSVYTGGKKRTRFTALVSMDRFSQEIDKILEKYKFQEIQVPKELSGSPSSSLKMLDVQLGNILKTHERNVLLLRDAVLAQIERLKVKEKLGKTARVFVLEAWVAEEEEVKIQQLIIEAANGSATVTILAADEPESEIPTLLRNRKILGHFRILTEMYGLPMYNEIDPTPFIAIFFTFFVGLMSADLAIGTTLIIGSLLIRRGAGSRSETMKDLSVVLSCIGISAMFFGFLTGELMGDLLKLPVLWISVADHPIEFLFIVIGIGIAHVAFGAVLGFINNFYRHEYRRIVGDQLSTLLLLAAAAIFLMTGRFEFEGVGIVGYVIGIVGLVMLIAGRGLIGMLELTRLLSSVISYVRILALNMATAWMSRTFVLLGGLLFTVYLVGPVLNGALLMFSHFFIVFISAFATFAHSLRLHYVEFFGRFFIGGGTKFSSLSSERRYTTPQLMKNKVEKRKETQSQLGQS